MAYDNKPNLNSEQFEQKGSDYIYLAGHNCICSGGTISSDNGYKISGITIFNTGVVSSAIEIGCNAQALAIATTVIGSGACASGTTGISIGCNAISCGVGSVSLGVSSKSNGNYSITIGNGIANGNCAISIGNAKALCNNALAIGNNVYALGNCATAIGSYILNQSGCSFGLGWYSGTSCEAPSILFSNATSYFYGCGDPRIGIGTCYPTARIDINTSTTCGFRLVDGCQGVGKVLKSDACGYGKWGSVSGAQSTCNGLTLCGTVICLGGNLITDTLITATGTTRKLSFCNGAHINSQYGYEISGYTILKTSSNTIESIYLGHNAGSDDYGDGSNFGVGWGALNSTTTGYDNIALGYYSLYNNTDGIGNIAQGPLALAHNINGCNNIAIGGYTLCGNISGSSNIAIGSQALNGNISGSNNIAQGYRALIANTTGSDNIAQGIDALYSNIIGNNNIAQGNGALSKNTCGSYNIAQGYSALGSNTIGNCNIALGESALFLNVSGSDNIAMGNSALFNNTSGCYNIAQGISALAGNISGCDNIAQGRMALMRNSTGCDNIAIGNSVLFSNDDGVSNIGIGNGALEYNVNGRGNIALGGRAMNLNISGCSNTAYGYRALQCNISGCDNIAQGYMTLDNNVSGSSNIAIGNYALTCNISGCGNVGIGNYAGYLYGSGNTAQNNRLYISNSNACTLIYGEFDNKLVCIDGTLCATDDMFATNFNQTSDIRSKAKISPIQLSPINIEYKEFVLIDRPNQLRYGVIAQELQIENPELVRCDSDGRLSVAYIDLLVKEIAYLKYKIIELEKKIK